MNSSSYKINFNQDFTSLAVLNDAGYRLFTLNSVNKIEEIYCKENEDIRIVERLFNSSLIVLVTNSKPNCLKMLHFKKKQDICNCVYPSDILNIRMNRTRLIVCLADSIHIHDIRDMKVLQSINDIPTNRLGLCSLSLYSHLAYPISSTTGELQIYNADNMTFGLRIKAHETKLSALNFSPNGVLIATSSERGTVIRVFCVKNAQKVHEFRRGVKRCVQINSLVFSANGDYISVSSNTETIHIFKIDLKAVQSAERRSIIEDNTLTANDLIQNASSSEEDLHDTTTTQSLPLPNSIPDNNNDDDNTNNNSSWSGYLTKAVTSYFPSQVYDVFSQDRAFATAQLNQSGIKHWCALARIQKELKLLVACEDGFLFIYDFNNETRGSTCKLIHVHDLRNPLDGVIELNMNDTSGRLSENGKNNKLGNKLEMEKCEISYAAVLKGKQCNEMTESDKCRNITDAIFDTPSTMFDENQFPPVTAPIRQ